MIFTQLRSFHAVATENGFTAASKVLHVGQPTLTSQVRALEDMFKVELFHRRGREIELTEAGEALLAVTRRIMDLEGQAQDLLNAFGGFHTGTLHVGAVGPYHATEMLSAFNEAYPGIRLAVTVGNSSEMVGRLLDYSADVAVLAHVEDDPRIFAMPYSRHDVVVFAHKSHPLAKRKSIRIEELERERMVLRESGSTTRRALEAALDKHGVTVDPVMEIMSTSGCDARAVPTVGPSPCTRLKTPGGNPASSISSASRRALSGASSLGLRTTVHPAAIAGANFAVIW